MRWIRPTVAALAGTLVVLAPAAQPEFVDRAKRHLPADRDPCTALAHGDVDGDGALDLLVANGGSDNRLYLGDGLGGFRDATAGRLPADGDRSEAVALGDVDADGDLDLVTANAVGQQNRLYLNDGSGIFTDVTGAQFPVDGDRSYGIVLADVDRDGDLDAIFANTSRQQNRLYLNDGTGRFVDVTLTQLPTDADGSWAVTAGDVDGDGDQDLLFGNARQDRLYLNDGAGRFTDATAARLPQEAGNTHDVELGDVDGDGDLDIYLANSNQGDPQDRLFQNDGSGTFVDETEQLLPRADRNARAAALRDVDGDGDLDLALANAGELNRLQLNDGTGVFADVTPSRLPFSLEWSTANALVDVDEDGDTDLLITNFGDPNRLYLNTGVGRFVDATAGSLPSRGYRSSGIALADVDRDGDLDVAFAVFGQTSCS
ncbi:MAG: VCBS repeat-containing protein [Planctomycetota bacterium]